MREIKIFDVEAVIEKPVKDGRIIGLTAYEGKKAVVVIERQSHLRL